MPCLTNREVSSSFLLDGDYYMQGLCSVGVLVEQDANLCFYLVEKVFYYTQF
jgi:hypothetical protein